MSTPVEAGLSEVKDGKDRSKSIGRYVKRMSSIFKSSRPGKDRTSSAVAPSAAASALPAEEEAATGQVNVPEEGTTAPATAGHASPPADPDVASPPAPVDIPDPSTVAAPTTTLPRTQSVSRSTLQQERARALFAKYGLTLESHEWIAVPALSASVQRIEKPIRMRVHRTCHRCGATYGSDKVCPKCQHTRCKKCPRYPKKKATIQKPEAEEPVKEKPKKKRILNVTTGAGDEVAYQPTKQRVRRSCHKCETQFIPPTKTNCDNCRHIRCTKCPREPAKLAKWPNGYPGDVDADSDAELERELEMARRIWRKPRYRVRWECEECHSLFMEGSPQCRCGHVRCDQCIRKPLKRVKAERNYDPEVVKAVEAKLKALQVEDETLIFHVNTG